jgi:hypothetical protein
VSSLVRRIQIRCFKKSQTKKVPVLHPITGNVLKWMWPRRPGQLAYWATPDRIIDIFADTKHETLQPIVDILAEDAARRQARATA